MVSRMRLLSAFKTTMLYYFNKILYSWSESLSLSLEHCVS